MVVCGDRRICSNEISCRDRRIFYSASFFKVDMRRSQLGSLLDILALRRMTAWDGSSAGLCIPGRGVGAVV
eukprot:COSAG01_NODE_1112_length_11654_cov_8.254435_14_plen_71_part_00